MEYSTLTFGEDYMVANLKTKIQHRSHKLLSFRYDDDKELWKATHIEHKEFLATSTAEKNSFLLGRQKWTIHNDSEACSLKPTYTAVLKLTGCSEDEFTCDDGSCVSMNARWVGERFIPSHNSVLKSWHITFSRSQS